MKGFNSHKKSYFCKASAFDGRDLISAIWGWAAMEHMLWNAEQSSDPPFQHFTASCSPASFPEPSGPSLCTKSQLFPPFHASPNLISLLNMGLAVFFKHLVEVCVCFNQNAFSPQSLYRNMPDWFESVWYRNYLFALPHRDCNALKRHILTGITRSANTGKGVQPPGACSAFVLFAASFLAMTAQPLLWSHLTPPIPTPGWTGPIKPLL